MVGGEIGEGIVDLYGDGACSGNPGPGGYGAVLVFPGGLVEEVSGFEPSTTNNRMELKAVIEGLRRVREIAEEELRVGRLRVRLLLDSAYVANALQNRWPWSWRTHGFRTKSGAPVKNVDLWKEMLALLEGISWEVDHVPGHSGVPGNERADELARSALRRGLGKGNPSFGEAERGRMVDKPEGIHVAEDVRPSKQGTDSIGGRVVPQAFFAIIGGSSTFSLHFPTDLKRPEVRVLEEELVFSTPFGESPPFTLFEVQKKRVLTVRMHGWRPPHVSRADASRQVFWVLHEAGVRRIFAEGGVGSLSRLLELRDFVIPDDYIDMTMRTDTSLGLPYLLVMREPICPVGASILAQAAEARTRGTGRRVFRRGVYVATDGRHFESRSEVQAFRQMGGDVVGQSLVPEVYLAREIGACYAGIHMVTNYGEGVIRDWSHGELENIFYNEAELVGNILIDVLLATPPGGEGCQCLSYRKPTLLQDSPPKTFSKEHLSQPSITSRKGENRIGGESGKGDRDPNAK